MRVIAKAVLIAFWIEHPDAEAPLQAWYRIIERTSFKDFNDLRATFAGADAVDGLTVFDFGGNPYRLIAALHYNRRKVYVRCRPRPRRVQPRTAEREKIETMSHARAPFAESQAILNAWLPFKRAIGVTAVRTEAEYRQALATVEVLLDAVSDDESHPLAEVLDYLADRVKTYEDAHCAIPEAEPRAVLRFLMDQHGLKQTDLADCAPQSRISEILNGQRAISKALAKRLAARFRVSADVFL